MKKVSSTYLNDRLGRCHSAGGLGSKLLHEQVSYNGTDRGTNGCAMDLSLTVALEEEMGIF